MSLIVSDYFPEFSKPDQLDLIPEEVGNYYAVLQAYLNEPNKVFTLVKDAPTLDDYAVSPVFEEDGYHNGLFVVTVVLYGSKSVVDLAVDSFVKTELK